MSSTSEKFVEKRPEQKRSYRLGARAEAAQRTRESVLDAGERAFADRWYDEVTLGDVAREAGVSQQTVVNHFGSKENLYLVGLTERWLPRVEQLRATVRIGDVGSIVGVAVDDYEATGISTLRVLALADRSPTLADIVAGGRAFHHRWVAEALGPLLDGLADEARAQVVRLVSIVLDVRTWDQLRQERSTAQTKADLVVLIGSILAASRATGEVLSD